MALVVGWAGFGCPSDPCDTTEAPAVEGGAGPAIYAPLEDGDDLPMIFGAQGKYMVYGSARFTGIAPGNRDLPQDPDNPLLSWDLATEDGPVVNYPEARQGLKVRTDGTVELVGDVIELAIHTESELAGREADFSLFVRDVCGTEAEDRVHVVVVQGESAL